MKDFLTRNKIYIETLSSLLFGLAALLVSISSYKLSERQLKLSEVQVKPFISLNSSYVFGKEPVETEIKITATNTGGELVNLESKLDTLLKVNFEDEEGVRTVNIPILAYYLGGFETGKAKGEILNFISSEHYQVHKFMRETLKASIEGEYTNVTYDLLNLLTLKYEGKVGETNETYFINNQKVSREKFLDTYSDYHFKDGLFIDELSLQEVEKRLPPKHITRQSR